jgi:hypothetical protein
VAQDNASNSMKVPIMVSLRNRLDQGKRILAEEPVKRSHMLMFSAHLKSHFTTIYGADYETTKRLSPSVVPEKANFASEFGKFLSSLERFIDNLDLSAQESFSESPHRYVFIGHGQSAIWRELKDFIGDRLHLPWDEFNREATAGYTTLERISEMLKAANFAFLIMTSEDEHSDSSMHARENVVHEVGLFQGKLGPKRAIVLLEEGCSEFSNIVGLVQLRFPRNKISAIFDDIRRVLEREGIISQ